MLSVSLKNPDSSPEVERKPPAGVRKVCRSVFKLPINNNQLIDGFSSDAEIYFSEEMRHAEADKRPVRFSALFGARHRVTGFRVPVKRLGAMRIRIDSPEGCALGYRVRVAD